MKKYALPFQHPLSPVTRYILLGGAAFGLILGGILGLQLQIQSHAAQATSPSTSAAGIMQFDDTHRHTSLIVQTDIHNVNAGVLTFVAPDGTQYHGGNAQDMHMDDNCWNDQNSCNDMVEYLGYKGALQVYGSSGNMSTVTGDLEATVHVTKKQAEATLHIDTGNQHFEMDTDIPGGQTDILKKTDDAAINQDWATLYQYTADEVTGSMTEAQFAQTMTQQTQSTGRITAIQVTSDPQVQTNDQGITFFTVQEKVTISTNGISQTQNMVAAYVLEDGTWKLWYSNPI